MALPTASDNVFPKVIISEAAAPGSPSSGQFKLYVDSSDHLLKYKNSSGTVVTLGQGIADTGTISTYVDVADQGSDPSSPSAGKHRFYAKSGGLYVKDSSGTVVGALGAGGGGTTGVPWVDSSSNPDRPAASPNALDDEFDAGSLDAKWTNVNSVTTSFAGSKMILPTNSEFRQAFAPGAGVAFDVRMKWTGVGLLGSVDGIGINVYDSTPTAFAQGDMRNSAGSLTFNRDNPGGSSQVTWGAPTVLHNLYLRVTRDTSNNYTFFFSFDGVSWFNPVASSSSSTTVAHIGFRIINTGANTWKRWSIDWFRRIS